jgi:epsilon-lactone hydrolase
MASPEYLAQLAPWLANFPNKPPIMTLAMIRGWMSTPSVPTPGTATITPVSSGGIPGEWVVGRKCQPGRRILYLHGGGYCSGNAAAYRYFTAILANATGCAVLAIDYRLGPEHPCPAAVHDAVAAYRWLRAHGPAGPAPAERVFIMGDSAGGGLSVATVLALRDGGHPQADAVVGISAYLDCTHSGASMQENATRDLVNLPSWMDFYATQYLQGGDPRDPLASPLFADLRNLPPMLLQVGGREMLRDDSVRLAAKARAVGTLAIAEVWPDMIHDWHFRLPTFPEARAAVARLTDFLAGRS